MAKETLKTSPDLRGGEAEFYLLIEAAKPHCKGVVAVDIWILKNWGHFYSQPAISSFYHVSYMRGRASVSTCLAPYTALTVPLHSMHNSQPVLGDFFFFLMEQIPL